MDGEEPTRPTNQEIPADPTSPTQEAAVIYHEIYVAYQAGGFTKEEALTIVIGLITQKPK